MIEGDYLRDRIRERQWIAELIENGGCCWICGWNEEPRLIEQHHIAGKHNSNITIPTCPICHKTLTLRQKSWPVEWKKPDNPPKVKVAFLLRGMSDTLRQISDEMLSEGD